MFGGPFARARVCHACIDVGCSGLRVSQTHGRSRSDCSASAAGFKATRTTWGAHAWKAASKAKCLCQYAWQARLETTCPSSTEQSRHVEQCGRLCSHILSNIRSGARSTLGGLAAVGNFYVSVWEWSVREILLDGTRDFLTLLRTSRSLFVDADDANNNHL
jgi:hypothetical protein